MKEYSIIDPKVQIVDYGPKLIDPKTGKILMTPDQIVALSSGWTYKNTDVFQNYDSLKKEEKDLNEAAKKILIQSAGRGHASLSTSIGMWLNIQNSSKMVDSYFTGANFGSSLMPSGRRTGINLDQIVMPANISRASSEIQETYVKASEHNIKTYEELMTAGIKQDAAGKIVQYGIAGGGFMWLPLETLVGFSRDIENNLLWIPREIPEIIEQIENKFSELGMGMTYSARKGAARLSYPWPTIFKSDIEKSPISKSIAIDKSMRQAPKIIKISGLDYSKREQVFAEYLTYLQNSLSSPESIQENWETALQRGGELTKAFNSTLELKIGSAIPWRVWGEVKRHRTMHQNPESIYSAIERAREFFGRESDFISKLSEFEEYVSIPPEIKKNPELAKKWLQAFYQSFYAYDQLVKRKIPKPDALQIIPRGLKIGNEKTLDLYNLMFGYFSLRLCGTAEEEMKRMSQQEFKLIQDSFEIPSQIKSLIRPKCGYVGFCLEPWAKCKNCMQVQKYIPFEYTEQAHIQFESARKENINAILESLK